MIPLALRLAARGFPVFPLAGKIPLPGSRGCLDATTDPEMIRKWKGGDNVGIATGMDFDGGRLLVVDFDAPKGGEAPTEVALGLLSALGCLPSTAGVRTGSGGLHLYYRAPHHDCPTIGARVKVHADRVLTLPVDWRGRGGYVVAPGSIHPKTGQRYRWEVDSEWTAPRIADAPAGLLALIRPKALEGGREPRKAIGEGSERMRKYFDAVMETAVDQILAAAQGERHNAVRTAAIRVGGYVRAWVDVGVVEATLIDAGVANKRGGKREIARAVRWGLDAGQRRPIAYGEEL